MSSGYKQTTILHTSFRNLSITLNTIVNKLKYLYTALYNIMIDTVSSNL